VSVLFSAVFLFQVFTEGNILGIGRNKSRSSYFADTKTEFKGEMEKGNEPATPGGGAAQPLATPPHGVGPQAPTYLALPPRNSLHRENPKGPSLIHEKYCKPPASSILVWEGPEALPGTLPERGIITGGLLQCHAYLRSDA
jgi:hypothetical protein